MSPCRGPGLGPTTPNAVRWTNLVQADKEHSNHRHAAEQHPRDNDQPISPQHQGCPEAPALWPHVTPDSDPESDSDTPTPADSPPPSALKNRITLYEASSASDKRLLLDYDTKCWLVAHNRLTASEALVVLGPGQNGVL